MADKAQRGFYLVVEEIKNELINNPSIKTMTSGDITDMHLRQADYLSSSTYDNRECSTCRKDYAV